MMKELSHQSNIKKVSIEYTLTTKEGRQYHRGVVVLNSKKLSEKLKWFFKRQRVAFSVYQSNRAIYGLRRSLRAFLLSSPFGRLLNDTGAVYLVDGGLDITTNRLKGAGTEPKFGAWGTGAGTTARTDTTLFSESGDEARTSGTSSRQTTNTANDTFQVIYQIVCAAAGKTITNTGLFDANAAGNLFLKGDHAGQPLNIGDSITYTAKAVYDN